WFKPYEDIMENTTITVRNTGGTDHLGFDAVGIPGFQFIQDPVEYWSRTHHTNMDTYERLVIDDLQQIATIVAGFVYNTAMQDEMLPREEMDVSESD
ncbi:MAG: M28 family peptidase, partial [Ekhidna sp.]